MAKPSLNYYQALHVGKVKTDVIQYTSIKDAIDDAPAVTDKRFAVYVHPGTYKEKIEMKDFCDVIAIGGREETVITYTIADDDTPAHDIPTVKGADAMLKGFTIVSNGLVDDGNWRTRCVENLKAGFEIEDCVLTPQNPGDNAITFYAEASCDMRDCVVDSLGTAATGALFTTADQTYNVERTSFNAATDAIQVTLAITALNLRNCTVSNNFNQDGGTVNVRECEMTAVVLGTTACDFTASFSRITAGVATESVEDDVAHTMTLIQCDLNNGGVASASTAGTTLHAYGCSHMGLLAHAGTGAWVCRDCDVGGVNFTSTGTLTLNGGDLGSVTRAAASVVWWRDSLNIYVLPSGEETDTMVQYAINAAAAIGGGQTIHIGPGTFEEALVCDSADDVVTLIGEGRDKTIITIGTGNTLTVTECGTVCVENLTLKNTAEGGIGVHVESAEDETAASLTMLHVKVDSTEASIYGIYTEGTAGVVIVLWDCDITATSYAVYCDTSAGTNTVTMENCYLSGATDDLNIADDCTVTSRYCTYATGGITVASDSNCVLRSYDDNILGAISKGADGVMTCREGLNVWRVHEGMEIMDAAEAGAAGDTVLIGPGTFTEALVLDDAVHAKTYKGFSRDKTIITQSGDTVEVVNLIGVVFEDITIKASAGTDGEYALHVRSGGVTLRNVTIEMTGTHDAGVTVYGLSLTEAHSPDVDAYNCKITCSGGDTSYAIYATDGTLKLYDCIINGETYDIYNDHITVEAHDCELNGGGWYVADVGTAVCLVFNNEAPATTSRVTFAGTSGQFADLTGAQLYDCAVTVTLGEAVYVDDAYQVAQATNAGGASAHPAEGVVVYMPTTETCYVIKHGYAYLANPVGLVGTAYTVPEKIWLGEDGGWLDTKPTGVVKQQLGVAVGPTGDGEAKAFLIDIALVTIEEGGGVLSIPIAWAAGSAPTGTHISNNARRAVAIVQANGQTVFSQAIGIPDDYLHDATNNKLYAILFPTSNGGIDDHIDWTAYSCVAGNGENEAIAAHSGTDSAVGQDVTDDVMLFLDISGAFTTYEATEGDILNIQLIIDAMDAPVTQVCVLGFRLEYTRQV